VSQRLVSLLDASTRLVFRLFGRSSEPENAITEEEIKTIVAEAETAGVIETDEKRMISGVLRLGDPRRPGNHDASHRCGLDQS
jgi:putative hemolysin